MLFNSLHFILLFFPIAVVGYFLLPHRHRVLWLLAASCYFYMAFVPYYILILVGTILVDYFAGLAISRATGPLRRGFLVASIVANVGILAVFKYFEFLRQNIAQLSHWLGADWTLPGLTLILPIGLSFHTFQSMSYTIEVYRGKQEPERSLLMFALYVLFFPQLVAGPIERPQNLLHQFHERHYLDYHRVVEGLKLIAWGLFQKMVIADSLATLVDKVYSNPSQHTGLPLVIGTILFAFQILCDFAGYSDVAIGTAQVLGFRLMTNFRQPYLAQSVAEFWKRWHISLSTWFRDYLYFPLGGNRKGEFRRFFNVIIVFAVSGLWHGADWKFVIWGTLNGLFVVFSGSGAVPAAKGVPDRRDSLHSLLVAGRTLMTFAFVCCTWVFFRAKSVSDAVFILRNLYPLHLDSVVPTFGRAPLASALTLILVTFASLLVRERYKVRQVIKAQPPWIRWPAYVTVVMVILLAGEFASRDFIYFQF